MQEDAARRRPSASKERALTRCQPCWCLDLGLPVPRTVRNEFLLFKLPHLQYLLWQPELTGTAVPDNSELEYLMLL